MSANSSATAQGGAEVSGRIRISVENGIAWITLDNAAKYNAISSKMWDVVVEAFTRFEADAALRCVVFVGEGEKAFCAGADLEEKGRVEREYGEDEQERIAIAALAKIQSFPKPTIAMISGYCLGAGVALAVACDLRIASVGSRFGIPAAKLGLPYYYDGMQRLCYLLGLSNAKRIIFTADRISSEEALRMGLVDQVVSAGELRVTVGDMAARIAANAPLAISAAKFAIETVFSRDADRDIAGCTEREQACRKSEDHLEGLRAFMEKRPPIFRGK